MLLSQFSPGDSASLVPLLLIRCVRLGLGSDLGRFGFGSGSLLDKTRKATKPGPGSCSTLHGDEPVPGRKCRKAEANEVISWGPLYGLLLYTVLSYSILIAC